MRHICSSTWLQCMANLVFVIRRWRNDVRFVTDSAASAKALGPVSITAATLGAANVMRHMSRVPGVEHRDGGTRDGAAEVARVTDECNGVVLGAVDGEYPLCEPAAEEAGRDCTRLGCGASSGWYSPGPRCHDPPTIKCAKRSRLPVPRATRACARLERAREPHTDCPPSADFVSLHNCNDEEGVLCAGAGAKVAAPWSPCDGAVNVEYALKPREGSSSK